MTRARTRRTHLAFSLSAICLLSACATSPFPDAKRAGTSLSLAERAADAGEFTTAAALYDQAYEDNPRSLEALLGLARSYAGMGQTARAETMLRQAISRRPNNPDVRLELARAQIASGQAGAALSNLDIAARAKPRALEILTARGIALDMLSRHAEAQAVYRTGLAQDPTDFALLTNYALSLGLSGETVQGIRLLRELAQDARSSAQTRGNLALLYGLAGRERDARATLAMDLSKREIESNIAYYRQLRRDLGRGA